MPLLNDIGRVVEGAVKGVLSLPNDLRRLSDTLGTEIYGGLESSAREFEEIARPQAEEFFGSQAGSKVGRLAASLRPLQPLLPALGIIVALFLILRR